MKSSMILGMLVVASMPLLAQNKSKLPKWVSTTPQSTPTSQLVVSTGKTIQEARHNAINQLIGLTSLNKEENSYQKRLLDNGHEPISQHQTLVAAAETSSFFPILEKYQEDDECYVLCEMSSKNLLEFSDSLLTAVKENTIQLIQEARKLRQQGDLYGSATRYSTALQGIIPMIHKQLYSEEGDLVEILHKEYVTSLDDIVLKLDRQVCPMVMGEEVPLDIMVTATYNGLPVSALPLTFKITDDGSVIESVKTDGKGRAKTRIQKAPTKETAKLSVYTDLLSLSSTIPSNMFSMELTQHLALEPKKDVMTLNAFDPTPTYYIAQNDPQYACVTDSLNAMMKRSGRKAVEKQSDADLIITLEYKSEREGNATTGKYTMQNHLCDMNIVMLDRRTNAELARAEKTGLRLFLPSTCDDKQLVQLALNELYKRMRVQLRAFQDAKFDKRKVMYAESK